MDSRGVRAFRLSIQRGFAVGAWWVGQMVCGLSILAGVLVLVQTDLSPVGQVCSAALVLAGIAALVTGRLLMVMATRRRRRRSRVY